MSQPGVEVWCMMTACPVPATVGPYHSKWVRPWLLVWAIVFFYGCLTSARKEEMNKDEQKTRILITEPYYILPSQGTHAHCRRLQGGLNNQSSSPVSRLLGSLWYQATRYNFILYSIPIADRSIPGAILLLHWPRHYSSTVPFLFPLYLFHISSLTRLYCWVKTCGEQRVTQQQHATGTTYTTHTPLATQPYTGR